MVQADGRTPPQTVEAQLSSRSTEIWLYGRPNWKTSKFPQDPGFLGNQSSTFKIVNVTEADKYNTSVTTASDTLTFGNSTGNGTFGELPTCPR